MTAEELYNRLKSVKPGAALCTYTMEKVEKMLPLINEINELKKEQDTVILAHSSLLKFFWALPTSLAIASS